MNSIIIQNSLMQVLSQAPILLVCVAGLIIAWIFRRRCRTPCLFVLIATTLLLLVNVGRPFVNNYLIVKGVEMDWPPKKRSSMFIPVGIVSMVLSSGALGLLLAAVFIERKASQPDPRSQPVEQTAAVPPSS